jgi:hypothetical protein
MLARCLLIDSSVGSASQAPKILIKALGINHSVGQKLSFVSLQKIKKMLQRKQLVVMTA